MEERRRMAAVPSPVLATVQALPGVEEAHGAISDHAQLVGRNGKVLSTGGAPGLAFSVHPHDNPRFNPLTLVAGTAACAITEAPTSSSTHSAGPPPWLATRAN